MDTPLAVHKPLVQNKFRGMYSRGVSDAVPDDYFIDSLNVKFGIEEVAVRQGSVLNFTAPNIVRFHVYERIGETPRFIWLDSSGNLRDSLYLSPIFPTDASFVDFSLVNYNNRAYITVHNRVQGLAGKAVLVYEGGGTARLAAGVAPTGFTLGVASSALSGSVEIGYHWFAVCFVTASGYITKPGPTVLSNVLAPGAMKVDLSSIPIGGSDVVSRIIVATKAIDATIFDGNQFAAEFFFIPNGTIENNVSTTLTVDFFDSELVDSADYLFDNLETLPAGLGFVVYDNRLGIFAANGEAHTIRLSNQLDPETFSDAASALTVDPSDGHSGITNAAVFRGNLILAKSNRLYSTTGTADDANTWGWTEVDLSVGTECFGFSRILDAKGANSDRLFIASRGGLVSFEGIVKRPELSDNLESYWKRINPLYFNLIQVVDEPISHSLFITIPLDSATHISHILYGDYSRAFTVYGTIDERLIKWSPWTLPHNVLSIAGDYDSVTKNPVVHLALSNGTIVDLKVGLTADYGNAIPTPYVKFALKMIQDGWVHQFGLVQFRVIGSGTMTINTTGEDGVGSTNWRSITLSNTPGSEPMRKINFKNEKCSVKVGVSLINETFTISKMILHCIPLWAQRPSEA